MDNLRYTRKSGRLYFIEDTIVKKKEGVLEYRSPITKYFANLFKLALNIKIGEKTLCINRNSFKRWLQQHAVVLQESGDDEARVQNGIEAVKQNIAILRRTNEVNMKSDTRNPTSHE